MSYKQELQDLIIRLRNNQMAADIVNLREQYDRWAEIIDFAINHTDEFKANLEVD